MADGKKRATIGLTSGESFSMRGEDFDEESLMGDAEGLMAKFTDERGATWLVRWDSIEYIKVTDAHGSASFSPPSRWE